MCLPLTKPQDGNITSKIKIVEGGVRLYTTHYECTEGYRLVGPTFRQCNPESSLLMNGKITPKNEWTGVDPQCIEGMLDILKKRLRLSRQYSFN